MDQPQVYLAQRLLTAATPKHVVDNLTGLAVKLFGNKVHTHTHTHAHTHTGRYLTFMQFHVLCF